MKSNYHERQQNRQEAYESLAGKNKRESESRFNRSSNIANQIPFGQPIFVGHYSEKRHRSDLQKIRNNMDKSFEHARKAEYYKQKAASVGKAGISSDNPDAIQELKSKLADLQKRQDFMKDVNKKYRKNGWGDITGLPEAFKIETQKNIDHAATFGRKANPFESYQLQNNNANIRRIKQRIAQLEKAESTPTRSDIIGEGYIIKESKEDNRIFIKFDGKPEKEIRDIVKRNGFRWVQSIGMWCRMLNNAGKYAADYVHNELKGV